MWLTGFDAPVLHTLYIDKPMRDHGLLQAIARVNRVFREKQGGLVVDYIGIGEDLRASLRAYDEAELDDPAVPIAQAIAGLWERYEVLCALLYPAGYSKGELGCRRARSCSGSAWIMCSPTSSARANSSTSRRHSPGGRR